MLRDNVEEKARDLLNHVKRLIPSNCLGIEAENMLFDFFKQSIWENNDIENSLMKPHLCKVDTRATSGAVFELGGMGRKGVIH